jgi:hypothetical protein
MKRAIDRDADASPTLGGIEVIKKDAVKASFLHSGRSVGKAMRQKLK